MTTHEYSEQLRAARLAKGLERRDLAVQTGISPSVWVDLEMDDGELLTGITLAEVGSVLRALELDPLSFFPSPAASATTRTLAGLVRAMREHLDRECSSVQEFEASVGWEVGPMLETPGRFRELPLKALIDVAKPLGLDWRPLVTSTE